VTGSWRSMLIVRAFPAPPVRNRTTVAAPGSATRRLPPVPPEIAGPERSSAAGLVG
jgi:hypothetical protein